MVVFRQMRAGLVAGARQCGRWRLIPFPHDAMADPHPLTHGPCLESAIPISAVRGPAVDAA
ncbi:hypothetical protein B551_0202470 [Cupriavidus sp. HPC(L)]|nr:hypothetical protein B551_0202470 [Cupriavidus sp. HPC(L)]